MWTLSVTAAIAARPCVRLACARCATFSTAKIASQASWGFPAQFPRQLRCRRPRQEFCRPPYPARSASNPGVAFILGLCPGLGAVYNGEYNKALIHVVVFVTLVIGASSDVDTGLMVILILSAVGFCFYMAIDAMRVARAKNLGVEIAPDSLESWSRNRPDRPDPVDWAWNPFPSEEFRLVCVSSNRTFSVAGDSD